MTEALLSLHLLDATIVGIALEGVALTAYRALTGRGVRIAEIVAFLGAGLALLVAVRLVLVRASWLVVVGVLALALALHLWHLAQRWNTGDEHPTPGPRQTRQGGSSL